MAVATTAREIRVLAPTGALGSGFLESSLAAAIDLCPHVIGCDAGTTDGGPYYLGSGETAFPRRAVKRDLRLMLLGARKLGVPLLIGSFGTAGADVHLGILDGIVREIAGEAGLSLQLALIHAEHDRRHRKSVVLGKGVAVRVALRGCRTHKKKK